MTTQLLPASERSQLVQLLRARATVMKNQARANAAVQLATFEKECATIYSKYDEQWEDISNTADAMMEKCKAELQKRCVALGIPREFRPEIDVWWSGRGENQSKERRAELRLAAKAEIDARAKVAMAQVDRVVADTMGAIITKCITSDEGNALLANLPTINQLMPQLTVKEAEKLPVPRGRRRRRR